MRGQQREKERERGDSRRRGSIRHHKLYICFVRMALCVCARMFVWKCNTFTFFWLKYFWSNGNGFSFAAFHF